MSREKIVKFWIWLFCFGSAMLIGGLSPLVFAFVGTSYFVLVPLAEIAPTLELPGLGKVEALLQRLGTSELERIDA